MIKPEADTSNKMLFKILDLNLYHSVECLTQYMGMSFLCQEEGDGIQGSKLLCLNGRKQFFLAVALPNLLPTINEVSLPSLLAWGCCGAHIPGWDAGGAAEMKPLCCLSQRTQGMFLALLHRAGSTVGIQRKENPGKNCGREGIFWYPLKGNTCNQRKGDFPLVEWSKHSETICVCA